MSNDRLVLRGFRVQAIGLQLVDGNHATLVQDGPGWNGLFRFKCIAPPQLDGQTVIACKDKDGSPLAAEFGLLFDVGLNERWVVVMTSPHLAPQLRRG